MGVRPTHILMVTIMIAGAIQLAEIYKPKKPSTASTPGGTFKKLGMPTTGGAVRIPKEAPPCHCPETDPKTGCKCTKVYKTTTTSTTPTTTSPADTPGSKTTATESPTTAIQPPSTSKRPTTWYTTTVTDPPTTTTTAAPTTTTAAPTTTTAAPTTTTAAPTTTSVESTTATPVYRDCQDAYTKGQTTSGIYTISPNGASQVDVYCEMGLENGGWTVFQRRMDGTVEFYRVWKDYKEGFGSAQGEHWIGNDHLHHLTAGNDTQLLVELKYKGETVFAPYTEFWVLSERLNYTLHVAGYTGGDPPRDSLAYHNGRPFTTRDRDNDNRSGANCAQQFSGAWWYHSCYESNLNGRYNDNSGKGVTWNGWKGSSTSLSATRMMVKSNCIRSTLV